MIEIYLVFKQSTDSVVREMETGEDAILVVKEKQEGNETESHNNNNNNNNKEKKKEERISVID